MTYLSDTILDIRVLLCCTLSAFLLARYPIEYLGESVTLTGRSSCYLIKDYLQRFYDWYYNLGIIGTSIGSLLAIEEECSFASLEIVVIILQARCICKVKTVAEILS